MSEKIEIKSIYIRPMWVDSKLKMMGIVEIGETNKFSVQVNLNDLDTAKLILLCKDYLARALSAKTKKFQILCRRWPKWPCQIKKCSKK